MPPEPTPTGPYPVLDHIGVPDGMRGAWQEVVDLLSEFYQVPAALIMRVHDQDIEVFSCSSGSANPYRTGHREPLTSGLYCEEVMRTRRPLLVADARMDPRWTDNPDISRGMVSYLGMPLSWPGGELFGTICVLDSRENHYSDRLVRLLEKIAHLIAADLRALQSSLQLEHANNELQHLHEEMGRFMGIAAHDMRNALNVFLGCSRHLLPGGDGLTERQLTYLDLIHTSGSTLLQLMDELMDIARFESMRLPLHIEEMDLGEAMGANVRFNQHLADAKGIQINLILPVERLRVRVDPGKLNQVLNNLLSNAMKFSPDRSTIIVSVDTGPGGVTISVRDQGPGIPRDEQHRLFSPFQTTSIQPTSGETSTGLGLYIARRIVEEHGGHIWVESSSGEGSTFRFTLNSNACEEGSRGTVKDRLPVHSA